jgi:glycine betaine catabolism A
MAGGAGPEPPSLRRPAWTARRAPSTLDCMISQAGPSPAAATPAAPVDQAGLARSLRPFGDSTMLPRAAYVDPAVFAWEQKHFFGSGWTCVGLSSQLAQPGEQRAESVGAGSVLLTRDDEGTAHAFANTCRHRGHELLPCGAAVQRNAIICPYHSWTYALSGGLRFASGFKGREGFEFDDSAWGLVELPLTEWHGLIFVNGSGNAPPIGESLRLLDDVVAPYEPERLVVAGRHEYDAAANWKILTENYHECYHCPMIHPELCKITPPKSGENFPAQAAWGGGWMDLRDGMDTMSLDGTSLGVPRATRPGPAHRDLREHLSERAAEPASRLRDDASPGAARRGPDDDRVHLGVRAGGPGQARLRPRLRGEVLGHHQRAGLGRL